MPDDRDSTAKRPVDPSATSAPSDSLPDVAGDQVADTAGATWDPSRGQSFFQDEDYEPNQAFAGEPAADPQRDASAATDASAGANNVQTLWGRDLADMSPMSTLKPSQVRSGQPVTPENRFVAAPGDIKVEGYELLEVLGEGGVGIVFQARQKSIDRQIAVKMIKPSAGQDAEEKAKFVSEAMVTGKLDHPNIVPVHDLGETRDGQPFYVMKMVRGTPWSQTIRGNPLAENLRILLDVCDAVAFAHSKDVIHRDLKPENVMLGEFGEVQLMDWGLGAVLHHGGADARVSDSQAAGGTPAYMAPEMVTGDNGPVGVHSDVYLLGAILYEIITGKPPHAGARVMDCLQNAIENVIQPTEQRGVLVDIAMKAMQTRPNERYPSVRAFKQALQDYQANAESIRLCERSARDLEQARAQRDYEGFAQALFGFRQALELWAGNAAAQTGVGDTQLHYARCAFEKGDFDLAASTLDPACKAHQALACQIAAAQRKRASTRRLFQIFRATAVTLTLAVIVILTIAAIWIAAARRQAVRAKEAAEEAKEVAVAAREAEAEQRQLAERARTRAQQEEAKAVQALAELEAAVAAMVAAQTKEEEALAKARAADLVAVQTRDELAKSGMLLDNSWWTFDAPTARRKQQAAAEAIGLPAELDITLPGDVALELVLIPPGEFVMGSPPKERNRAADEYLHRVRHRQAFFIGRYELTEAQWLAVVGTPLTGAAARAPETTVPATGMSVEQIVTELLPALQVYAPQGYAFRLPTEAEWEYACRAGTPTAYHAGDDEAALDAAGWYQSNSERRLQPVGQKQPNPFGLYDMHGNVSEICADEHNVSFYLESPVDDPLAAGDGERLVVRGGSILNTPEHCRTAYRSYVYRKNQYEFVGLRLALVPVAASDSSAAQPPATDAPQP